MLPIVALAVLAQDLGDTKGKTNAQILAMGRSRWHDFFVGKDEGVTVAESSAEALYGDALAWRNDRLGKRRAGPLRDHLQLFKNDAVGAGSACSGGGTMWNITAASLYADAEETLYAVLTRRRRAPRRVVSDVDKGLVRLSREIAAIEEPKDRKAGGEAMVRLRKDFAFLIADASRLPRGESDTILEFCRKTLGGVTQMVTPA